MAFPFSKLFGEENSVSSTTAIVSSFQQLLLIFSTHPPGVTPSILDNHTPIGQMDNDSSCTISTSVGADFVSDVDSQSTSTSTPTVVSPTPTVLVKPVNTHLMCTQAKDGVVKPRLQPTIFLAHVKPKSTKSAISSPQWLAAMKIEYEALMKNGTWSLQVFLLIDLLWVANEFFESRKILMALSINTKLD